MITPILSRICKRNTTFLWCNGHMLLRVGKTYYFPYQIILNDSMLQFKSKTITLHLIVSIRKLCSCVFLYSAYLEEVQKHHIIGQRTCIWWFRVKRIHFTILGIKAYKMRILYFNYLFRYQALYPGSCTCQASFVPLSYIQGSANILEAYCGYWKLSKINICLAKTVKIWNLYLNTRF